MQILVAQLNIRTALEVCPSAPAHFLAGHLRTIAPRILNMFFTLLAHPHALYTWAPHSSFSSDGTPLGNHGFQG